MSDELEKLKYYPGIFQEGLRRTLTNSVRIGGVPAGPQMCV
jgi:hypothetical protein